MDIRKVKTQKAIKESFYNLLEKKSIDKITISELTNNAKIGRMTFYLHYEDIYALRESMENEILIEIASIFKRRDNEEIKTSLQRRISQTLDYVCQNKKEFNMIFITSDSIEKLVEFTTKQFLEEFYPEKKTNYGKVEVNFVAFGIVGVIQEWAKSDNSIDKSELEKILLNIISRFISELNNS